MARSRPYIMRWPTAICPHWRSLPTTETTGRSKRTKVSNSKPLRPKVPSPLTIRTFFSGKAVFTAIAKPVPTPSVPMGPGSYHWPG